MGSRVDGFTLQTERLLLRPYRSDDVEPLHAIQRDPVAWGFYPSPFTREQSEEWIAKNVARCEEHGFGMWAIELRTTGEFIDSCGPAVRVVDGIDEIELGWHVAPALRNRGFATEAATACRDHVFGSLGARRLISLVRPENVASCRVAEKIGMQVERDTTYGTGDFLHHVYALSASSPQR